MAKPASQRYGHPNQNQAHGTGQPGMNPDTGHMDSGIDCNDQVGRQIAATRKIRGMTQVPLAAAAGLSASLVTKIERAVRTVKPDVLACLARVLGVEPGTLAGEPRRGRTRIDNTIPQIRCAVDCYDLPEDGPTRALPELRARVEHASAWRLASQYTRLAEALPLLLTELTRAPRAGR